MKKLTKSALDLIYIFIQFVIILILLLATLITMWLIGFGITTIFSFLVISAISTLLRIEINYSSMFLVSFVASILLVILFIYNGFKYRNKKQ